LHSLPSRVSSKRQKITGDCTGDAVATAIAPAAAAVGAAAAAFQRLSTLESIHFTRVSSLNCRLVVLSVERAENGRKRQRWNKRTRRRLRGSDDDFYSVPHFRRENGELERLAETISSQRAFAGTSESSILFPPVDELVDGAALGADPETKFRARNFSAHRCRSSNRERLIVRRHLSCGNLSGLGCDARYRDEKLR